ncbi:MAG: hypothetical protein VW475_03325, partial [Curvibacter sp.]
VVAVVKAVAAVTVVAAAATDLLQTMYKRARRALFSWFLLGRSILPEGIFCANNEKVTAGRPGTASR